MRKTKLNAAPSAGAASGRMICRSTERSERTSRPASTSRISTEANAIHDRNAESGRSAISSTQKLTAHPVAGRPGIIARETCIASDQVSAWIYGGIPASASSSRRMP